MNCENMNNSECLDNNNESVSHCSLDFSEKFIEHLSPSPSNDDDKAEKRRTNYFQTLMLLLNGFVGSGILLIPYSFKDGGIVVATVMNPLIGFLACYCNHLLLSANQYVMRTTNQPPLDYHEVAEFAFRLGPVPLRGWAQTARNTVEYALIAIQITGCSAYLLFVSVNLNMFLVNIVGYEHAPSSEQLLAMIIPLLIAINWIREMRHLSIFSTMSNCLQLVGICIIFYNLLSEPLPEISRLPAVGDKIPQYFVSSLFIYEGISVSMSLYKAIDKPNNFSKPFGVLNVGLSLIIVIYCTLGFLGYARYGSLVKPSITLSLPSTALNKLVQLMYAIAILFTCPLILYVPIQFLWTAIEKRFFSSQFNHCQHLKTKIRFKTTTKSRTILVTDLLFRAALVLLTYILAAAVPRLELIIALVGSIISSSIVITFPAILNTVIFWEQTEGFCSKLCLLSINGTIIAIGLFAFVYGSYISIGDIVDAYQNDQIHA